MQSAQSKKKNQSTPEGENSAVDEATKVVQGGTFTSHVQAALKAPPSLVLIVGPEKSLGRQWLIDRLDMTIGRSANCDIVIDDASLSRTHSKISNNQDQVVLVDLESTNRTQVNSKTLAPFVAQSLTHNDKVKVGNVLFRFLEQGSVEGVAHQSLQTKSDRDPLTQIWSKGSLLQKAPEYIQKARILKEPLSLVVFDIDHFKKINDTHGHQAGDQILRELALVVGSQLIRSDDHFARYGGEEFVILLLGSGPDRAKEVSERIRTAIETHNFKFEKKTIPVTISIGVSSLRQEDSSWDDLFQRGDRALYDSKSSGRNRVTLL